MVDHTLNPCLNLSAEGFREMYTAKKEEPEVLWGKILYGLNNNNRQDLYDIAPFQVASFYDELAQLLEPADLIAAAEFLEKRSKAADDK